MSERTRSVVPRGENGGTTEKPFGRSVESQAQIADAKTISTGTEGREPLNVYRLEPIAPPADLRWDKAPSLGTVIVAARTAGDARIVAAGTELDFQTTDALPAEDVTTRHASVFRDEKAYTVVEIERGRLDLQRGMINGVVP